METTIKLNTTYRSNLGKLDPCCPPTPCVEEPGMSQWFGSGFESKQGCVLVTGIRSLCKTHSWILLILLCSSSEQLSYNQFLSFAPHSRSLKRHHSWIFIKTFQQVYLHHSLAPVLSSLSPSFYCFHSGIQSCTSP